MIRLSTSTAASFGKRVVAERKTDAERMNLAYELALARLPQPAEAKDAAAFLSAARERLRENGTPAEKVDAEAWSALARALFRLNEFVYLD